MKENLKEKAKRLRRDRQVVLVEWGPRRADALVAGDHGHYRVRLYDEGKGPIKAFCTCPSAEIRCSHALAALEAWQWQMQPWWAQFLRRLLIRVARLFGKELE